MLTLWSKSMTLKKYIDGIYNQVKWYFKPKITSIIDFEHRNKAWISGIFCAKIHIFWDGHKILRISTVNLSYAVPVKSTVEILQNFGLLRIYELYSTFLCKRLEHLLLFCRRMESSWYFLVFPSSEKLGKNWRMVSKLLPSLFCSFFRPACLAGSAKKKLDDMGFRLWRRWIIRNSKVDKSQRVYSIFILVPCKKAPHEITVHQLIITGKTSKLVKFNVLELFW